MYKPLTCDVVATTNCDDASYDGIVLVIDTVANIPSSLGFLKTPLQELMQIDSAVEKDVILMKLVDHAITRLIFAPTGPLNRDYDDVRRFGEAACAGLKRALKAGCKSPLLVCPPNSNYDQAVLVSVLGALSAVYVPLELREDVPSKASKADKIGVWSEDGDVGKKIVHQASAIESGRIVYRDIGGSDPERMAPKKVEEYVQDVFKDTCIQLNVISDEDTLAKEYPLHAAVNRCARHIDRHKGRIIELEYKGEGDIKQTPMIVGKGVT
ncbi:putative aminopeptidase W07G4.4, partial [Saccoglossus kowalevskii]